MQSYHHYKISPALRNKSISDANVHLFFRYVNSKLKNKSFVALLKDKNNKLLIKDSEKASLLTEYFTSVFTKDNGTNPVFGQRFDGNSVLSDIIFSTLSIKNALSHVNVQSAADPYGLPGIFFK